MPSASPPPRVRFGNALGTTGSTRYSDINPMLLLSTFTSCAVERTRPAHRMMKMRVDKFMKRLFSV